MSEAAPAPGPGLQPGLEGFGPPVNLVEPDIRRQQIPGNTLDSAGILPEEQMNTAATVEGLYPNEKERLMARAALRVGAIAETVSKGANGAAEIAKDAPSVSELVNGALNRGEETAKGLIESGRKMARNLGSRITGSLVGASYGLTETAKGGVEDVKAGVTLAAEGARSRKEARIQQRAENKAARLEARQVKRDEKAEAASKREEFLKGYAEEQAKAKQEKRDTRDLEKQTKRDAKQEKRDERDLEKQTKQEAREKELERLKQLGKDMEAAKAAKKQQSVEVKIERKAEKQAAKEQKARMEQADREKLMKIREIKMAARDNRRLAAQEARAQNRQEAAEARQVKVEEAKRIGKAVVKGTVLFGLGVAVAGAEAGAKFVGQTKEAVTGAAVDLKANVEVRAAVAKEAAVNTYNTGKEAASVTQEWAKGEYHARRSSMYSSRETRYQNRAERARTKATKHSNLVSGSK